jgi:hypothetical protein
MYISAPLGNFVNKCRKIFFYQLAQGRRRQELA